MKRVLIVGGANGIGLSLAHTFAIDEDIERVYIVDRVPIEYCHNLHIFESYIFDLQNEDYSFFDRFSDIDALIITAGFGKLALFEDVNEDYIVSSFNVNAVAPIRIIKHFYNKLKGENQFRCAVMVSIAGFMSSPFFSVYAATKAALKIFIESVNVELEKSGSRNRILNISPGSIKGTSFNQGKTNLELIQSLAGQIINHMVAGDDLFIPQYDEIFKQVLERYHDDFREEGRHSYDYKLKSGRFK